MFFLNSKKCRPYVAIILDGFGIGPKYKGNAVEFAKKPVFDALVKNYPSTQLGASGEDVGLAFNRMSGSEVGHANIGAGRVVKQSSQNISNSIWDGSFYKNPVFLEAANHVKKYNSKFHLVGLMSNRDSPHSRRSHFTALLEFAKKNQLKKVFSHLFTDGRDSKPRSAKEHLKKWEGAIKKIGVGEIATIGGRFYGMDRTKKWNRLKKAYSAIVFGKGDKAVSAMNALDNAYVKGLIDEYILPTVILKKGIPVAKVENDDAIIFFNLRSDRARQLTKLFVLRKSHETRLPSPRIKNLYFVTLTGFGPNINTRTAFNGSQVYQTLPTALAEKKQLYISEAEKYAHVTYFLNGSFSDPVAGEDRIMIPSPDVASYSQEPKMSAKLLTGVIIKYIKEEAYDFILVNYPNPDMLGHTGDIKAAVSGIEFLDKCIGKIKKEACKKEGGLFIFSDHGNADEMLDRKTGEIITFHTKNPVPFLVVSDKVKGIKLQKGGKLGNITPTILKVMGVEKEKEMINSLF